jgi:hypothetical protein
VWTHDWNGRDNQNNPVPTGPTVLHVESLAAEVEGLQDQEEFNQTS